jgi:hypothetical protein
MSIPGSLPGHQPQMVPGRVNLSWILPTSRESTATLAAFGQTSLTPGRSSIASGLVRKYEFALDDLPVRPVDVGRLIIQTYVQLDGDIGSVLLVLDADRDEFVRLPLDPLELDGIQALGHDGRHLLLNGRGGTPMSGRVGLYTLASGDRRWFARGPDGSDHVASLSPTGRHIAALNFTDYPESIWDDDPEPVAIGMIDLASGERHRVWTGPRAVR